MKEVFAKSVYAMEPQSGKPGKVGENCWNDGHWNYQWQGRNSKQDDFDIHCRKEADGHYLVQDEHGVVWLMDETEFQAFQSERRHSVA